MEKNKIQELFSNSFTNANTYVIAEIGINHEGKIRSAKDLMEAACESGADAVKFQKRDLNEIYTSHLLEDANSAEWSFQYLLPQLKKIELSNDDYFELNKYAKQLNLDLIVTPFDCKSARFIRTLNLAAVKIASADMTNWPLIQEVAQYNLPLIVSTGMWPDEQVAKTSRFLKALEIDFALLHCQSVYPAPIENINLRYLKTLKDYAPVIGYSGHERGITTCLGAVGMGARIIEKHITRDHTMSGPDHKASLEPNQFRTLIHEIRQLDKILGQDKKVVSPAEILNKHVFSKSLTANYDLPSGHILEEKDVIFLSPGKGIAPCDLKEWIGRALVRPKKKHEYLTEDDFQTAVTVDQWGAMKFSKHWGVKCRFHDFNEYSVLNAPVVEFHCSDKDVVSDFDVGNLQTELIIHAPEIIDRDLVDLCSTDEEIAGRSLVVLQQTINKAAHLRSKFKQTSKPKIVLHVGGMFLDNGQADTIRMMSYAEKRLSKLDLNGVALLPENLPPRPWYLGGQWYQHAFVRPDEIRNFCRDLSLGMTLDICHAQLYCAYTGDDLLDYIKTVMPVVKHLHISDARGFDTEGVQIDEGEIDFDAVFNLLEKTKCSWVPEIWSGHINHGRDCHLALQRLQRYREFL